MLLLFDISKSQVISDYELLKKRTSGGFIKATQGTFRPDKRFSTHWENTRKAGIPRGAYHFWMPGKPKTQAKLFFDTVNATGDLGELPPVLDVERKGKASEVKMCAEEIENLFGRPPMIYTRQSIFDFLVGSTTWASKYPLWVANYIKTKDDMLIVWKTNLIEKHVTPEMSKRPAMPKDWTEWQLWQFTQRGAGPNWGTHRTMSKQIDLNVFEGTLEELLALGGTTIDQLPVAIETLPAVEPTLVSESVLDKIKESGITPTIQVNINMADFKMKAFRRLKRKLEKAGVTPEVHINIQVGSGGAAPRGSDPIQDPDSGQPETPISEPEPESSFTVTVKAIGKNVTVVQSFKDRNANGVPNMEPHVPRIKRANGSQLRVSKTHTESDRDNGDGVIHGGGNRVYYKITDDKSNGKAAGKFVKQEDVKKV